MNWKKSGLQPDKPMKWPYASQKPIWRKSGPVSNVEQEATVRRQLEAAGRTVEPVRHRYEEGLVGFIELLDARRGNLVARQVMTVATRDRLIATASLYKSLNGGWCDNDAEKEKFNDILSEAS